MPSLCVKLSFYKQCLVLEEVQRQVVNIIYKHPFSLEHTLENLDHAQHGLNSFLLSQCFFLGVPQHHVVYTPTSHQPKKNKYKLTVFIESLSSIAIYLIDHCKIMSIQYSSNLGKTADRQTSNEFPNCFSLMLKVLP